jgi:hypothetical protein
MTPAHHRAICALLFTVVGFASPADAASISGQGTWETTLLGRDLDGNASTFEAYYDTVLDITWLANANGSNNSDPGFDYGLTTWDNALSWAAGLNVGGITGWRLPTTNPIDGTTADDWAFAYNGTEDQGYNVSAPGTLYAGSTASELAHMFYNTLGNIAFCEATSTTDCIYDSDFTHPNTGPFSDLAGTDYWSATTYSIGSPDNAWRFSMWDGRQSVSTKTSPNNKAWAVHNGDVAAAVVPVPAAAWLFASGLAGLLGMARRKKKP